MYALPFDPLEVVAVNHDRNIHRRWRIAAHRDLFGHIVIETCWGRIGTGGRLLAHSFEEETQALHYVRALLKRRKRACRRIGADYVRTDQAG